MLDDTARDSAARSVGDTVIELADDPSEASAIAVVAAATFPLACPPHSTPDDVAAHIAMHLAPANVAAWIADDAYDVVVARHHDDGVIGYTLLVHSAPSDDDVRTALGLEGTSGPARITEISKMYVLPEHHGTTRSDRPSHRLMAAALDVARAKGSTRAWLGVNQENRRALRYYAKMGFTHAGTKTFDMNGAVEHDYVLVRDL
ncbi:GNAT family N-acetyltransferase [Gordonia iterans]